MDLLPHSPVLLTHSSAKSFLAESPLQGGREQTRLRGLCGQRREKRLLGSVLPLLLNSPVTEAIWAPPCSGVSEEPPSHGAPSLCRHTVKGKRVLLTVFRRGLVDQPVISVFFRIQIQKLSSISTTFTKSWLQLVCGSSKVLAFSLFYYGLCGYMSFPTGNINTLSQQISV